MASMQDMMAMKRYMEIARMGMQDRMMKDGGMMPNPGEMFQQMWMTNPRGHMPGVMMTRPIYPVVPAPNMEFLRDETVESDMHGKSESDLANFRSLQNEAGSADSDHAKSGKMQSSSKRRKPVDAKAESKKPKGESSSVKDRFDPPGKESAAMGDAKYVSGSASSSSFSVVNGTDYSAMPGTALLQQHDLGGISKCVLCSKGEPAWFLIPCGHTALCDECAQYDKFFSCTQNLPLEQCPACGECLLDPYFMHLPMLEHWLEVKALKRGIIEAP
jgi:hypothetical protein